MTSQPSESADSAMVGGAIVGLSGSLWAGPRPLCTPSPHPPALPAWQSPWQVSGLHCGPRAPWCGSCQERAAPGWSKSHPLGRNRVESARVKCVDPEHGGSGPNSDGLGPSGHGSP